MNRINSLLGLLSDGRQHSGEALGAALGISRAAVWKLIARLRKLGVEVQGEAGSGYQLDHPFHRLDQAAIMSALTPSVRAAIDTVDVELSLVSTNQTLLAQAPFAIGPRVLLAECQTAGKGRRGRQWYSPFGASLYLSMLWPFSDLRSGLTGLSLVVGLAVAEALTATTGVRPQLKWPNDVLYQDKKLAGVLVEILGEPQGPCQVVIGIGINCRLPSAASEMIDQPWTDVSSLSDSPIAAAVDRNQLAVAVIDVLCRHLPVFAAEGFRVFRDAWANHDALLGRAINLSAGQRSYTGMMCGINTEGALLLDSGDGPRPWVSGDVSVRPVT